MYVNMYIERYATYLNPPLFSVTSNEAAKDNLQGEMEEWDGQEGENWDSTRRLSALV